MKNLFLALLVVVVLFSGCKKEETTNANCTDAIMNGTETGVDCGGSCGACISDTYYPLTAGTTHTYKMTNSSDTTFVMVSDSITSKDTLINGISYRIILETSDFYQSENFVRNSNGSLFSRIGSQLEQSQGNDDDFLFLKENAATGDSWTANVSNVWGSRICEVTETNLTLMLNGITFTNVCATKFHWDGHPTPFSTAYHAKGVGLIKVVSDSGYNTIEITSYTIK
jgi:hypothetical protein